MCGQADALAALARAARRRRLGHLKTPPSEPDADSPERATLGSRIGSAIGTVLSIPVVAAIALFYGFAWVIKQLLRLISIVGLLSRALWTYATGGWIALLPGFKAGTRGALTRLLLFVERYILFWLLVWWIQWCFLQNWWDDASTWLIGSRSELQTALQVLPATEVALFVLVAGSVFVVAQLAVTAYGQRATLLIGLDPMIQGAIARPLLLIVAALFLTGAVPDDGRPSDAATAAATTVILATAFLTPSVALLLFNVLGRYTAPVNFAGAALERVDTELGDGDTGLVAFRAPLLVEALKAALRRGDSIAVGQMLNALQALERIYLRALPAQPRIRQNRQSDGSLRDRWVAEDLSYGLVSAAQDALKLQSPESDTNSIAATLGSCGVGFLRGGQGEDAAICARGLIEMSVSAYQVGIATNVYSAPVAELAGLEGAAEHAEANDVAAYCLAGWALGVAYGDYHLGQKRHPEWPFSIRAFGPSPSWDAARQIVESDQWQERWANKQYKGPNPLLDKLRDAEREHGRRPQAGPGSTGSTVEPG